MAVAGATDVVMPQMGVSVSEGTITKWLKQVGETIEADESLLEISTDKVDTEVPSPGSGVVQEILVQEGETVDVGTRLAVIGPEGGAPAEAPPAPAEEEAPPEPATQAAADEAMAAASEGVGDVAPAASEAEAPPPPAPAPPPQQPSAHVTSAIEVDMSKVVELRRKLKPEFERSYGVNPTYLSFIARAVVETIKDYPWINGEIRGDKIVTRNYVNLGFAVELADGKGLIVPVLKNAETLNLLGIAKGVTDIAQRARDKKLVPDEVQGGTFTITNPGGYGTFHGTPVISQPQAAILGTYAVVKRPWVVQDEMGQDVIAIRPIMNLTLTYDHRLVDGALAGRFLRDLRQKLEIWGETTY